MVVGSPKAEPVDMSTGSSVSLSHERIRLMSCLAL
jgi:hypothetical protein